ncbi:hypothetical protein EST38_g5693 [Candolleomyces aberdarensis]|uniref:FAD-binding domain-containing protein n=1 Tax=Candolleomyces aberdarensis TaxID=2316362 RepID=A0A4Q2DN36_9AGAR|nr:hypothetical protein EST38_g5693 [Candolleomyces aberdarensis]
MASTARNLVKVAIVGAGPGGLTLAAILRRLEIPCSIFELDASPSARVQGSMLDIHKRSGQLALEKAGLLDVFKKHMRVDATEMFIRDHQGNVHIHHSEEGEEDPERPEIDRAVLRKVLLDGVDPDTIQWGKKLVNIEISTTSEGTKNSFVLAFADGTKSTEFDIVIGADGAWSRTRTLLRSSVPPTYVGITYLWSVIKDIDARYPELSEYVGKGSCFTADSGCKRGLVVAQKNGDGSLKSNVNFPAPENWKETSGIDWSKADEDLEGVLKQFVEKVIPEWNDKAKELITRCDEGEMLVRPLYGYPPGYRFENKVSGVTLLGDAAHVMPPFAGVGVNLAMHDAYDLALALEKIVVDGVAIDTAMEEYEETMMVRAGENAVRTNQGGELFFGGGGLENTVVILKKIFSGAA